MLKWISVVIKWITILGLVMILVDVGCNFYNQPGLCSRPETISALASLFDKKTLGISLKVSLISTLNKEGNMTKCSATMSFFKPSSSEKTTIDGVEYQVNPTDDGQNIFVQILGSEVLKIRGIM